jgi:hypothetical protein
MQNQIHALKHLGAQLVEARALIANADTTGLAQPDSAWSMLREAEALLDRLLELVREQVPAVRKSGPRTSGTL